MIKKLHNYALYLYGFSLPFEYWDPFGLVGAFSIVRIIAVGYLMLSFLNYSYSFDTNNIKSFSTPLILLYVVMFFSNLYQSISVPPYSPEINTSLLQNIILFFILLNHFKTDIKIVYKTLFAFALGIILLGILYNIGVGIIYRQGRLSVFGDNPNNQGTKVALGIFLLIYFVLVDKLNFKIFRFTLMLPIPILLKFIADSGSRGALLSLLLSFALLAYLFKVRKIYFRIVFLGIGIFSLIYVYQYMMSNELIHLRMQQFLEEGSLGGRENIWQVTLDIFLKSPVWGVGETRFSYEMLISSIGSEKSTHNYFLYVLVTSGFVGLFLFILYLIQIFKASLFMNKNKKEFLQLILFAIVIFGMLRSGGSLGDKSYWFVFAIIAGSYSYNKFQRKIYVKSYKLKRHLFPL